MAEQTTFYFKAATGYGAVVDGKVAAPNAKEVRVGLMRQGLIPVHVAAERRGRNPLFSLSKLLRSLPNFSFSK